MGGQYIVLLKLNTDTSTSGRKSAAKDVADTVVLKTNSFKLQRNDVGKGRKYQLKERFVQSMVKGCWDCVDPVGKLDMYQDLMALDGCAEGKYFYNSYLDPHKDSAASGFANCTKGFLNRFGWSMRENSIVQTVPKHWRKISEVNSVALSKLFRDEKLEVMLNTDQTFVYFYPEDSVVVAYKNTKRVGGRVKSDAKAGFTAMVTVYLGTIQMDATFVVYNGTKLKDSKKPKYTLAYTYMHWRDLSIGRSGHMDFQRKHWFDDDITIEYLEFLLDVVH